MTQWNTVSVTLYIGIKPIQAGFGYGWDLSHASSSSANWVYRFLHLLFFSLTSPYLLTTKTDRQCSTLSGDKFFRQTSTITTVYSLQYITSSLTPVLMMLCMTHFWEHGKFI